MNRFIHLFLMSLLSLLVAGCDSLRNEVDPERLNKEAGKLVVTGFLSPQDTLLAVSVSRSRTVLNDGSPTSTNTLNVTDAQVSLTRGHTVALLRYDSNRNVYVTDATTFRIEAGQTYKLHVFTKEGEKATSTCTIPSPVNLNSITFDSAYGNRYGRRQMRYFIRARWQDQAGQPNYYQVNGAFSFMLTDANTNPYNNENSTLIQFDRSNGGLITDHDADGQSFVSDRAYLESYIYYSFPSKSFYSQYKSARVRVDLLNVEQTYYQYQDAVSRQLEVSGNPFAEPVPIPSNIEGGLGCFAGYNRSTVTLKLK